MLYWQQEAIMRHIQHTERGYEVREQGRTVSVHDTQDAAESLLWALGAQDAADRRRDRLEWWMRLWRRLGR